MKGTGLHGYIWRFPKIRGTILGVPIIRTIVFWGLYWGPVFWESTILCGYCCFLCQAALLCTVQPKKDIMSV